MRRVLPHFPLAHFAVPEEVLHGVDGVLHAGADLRLDGLAGLKQPPGLVVRECRAQAAAHGHVELHPLGVGLCSARLSTPW